MRLRRLTVSALLVTAPALVGLPTLAVAPAQAAPTCAGKPATIVGTAGNDRMVGTEGRDVVFLGAGNDVFDGLGGNDLICGGSGRDQLAGGEGNDRIDGGGGKDYFLEGDGNDRLIGGRGQDYLSYSSWSTGINVTNATVIEGAGRDVATGIETIEGTAYADVMIGGPGDDVLRGLTGKDLIRGEGGNDYLAATDGIIKGGEGNDLVETSGSVTAYLGPGVNGADIGAGQVTVVGGRGKDAFTLLTRSTRSTIRGGGGDNQVSFLRTRRGVRVDLGRGRATWKGGSLSMKGVHTVIGTHRKDVLIGSNITDIMYGRGGDDVLRGRGGIDLMTGQGGRDRINGGGSYDYCFAEIEVNCEE